MNEFIRWQQMRFDIITHGVLHMHGRADNAIIVSLAHAIHEHRKIKIVPCVRASFRLGAENIHGTHRAKALQR